MEIDSKIGFMIGHLSIEVVKKGLGFKAEPLSCYLLVLISSLTKINPVRKEHSG